MREIMLRREGNIQKERGREGGGILDSGRQ